MDRVRSGQTGEDPKEEASETPRPSSGRHLPQTARCRAWRVKEVYAETSAVLGWLLGEKGSERFSASIDAAGRVLTSVLTILESNRGILRAGGEGRISQAKAARLKGLLARIAAQWYLME